MREMCFSTAPWVTTSASAIPWLERPSAIRPRTSVVGQLRLDARHPCARDQRQPDQGEPEQRDRQTEAGRPQRHQHREPDGAEHDGRGRVEEGEAALLGRQSRTRRAARPCG
jgi:hypothetical protein